MTPTRVLLVGSGLALLGACGTDAGAGSVSTSCVVPGGADAAVASSPDAAKDPAQSATLPSGAAAGSGGSTDMTAAMAGSKAQPVVDVPAPAPQQPTVADNNKPTKPAAPLAPSIGTGDMTQPAGGPAPVELAKLSGAPYTLIKNWDFGANGTIRNLQDLESEFQFHDTFGTIANGTNYGAVTVAPDSSAAIGALDLDLDDDLQPVEDPVNPTREWTADSLLAHVRPLSPKQKKVSVRKHNAGNGSFTSKWQLPSGGELLGHDLVWETRVRMPKQVPGYWFALWTAGSLWDNGAEMDVMESFGAPHTPGDSFHSDCVGGINNIKYDSWPVALSEVGVPMTQRYLADWHTWTWVYLRDDSYEVYYDGYRVQHGSLHWTFGGKQGAMPIEMRFLFDFSWGHTQIADVDIELPADMFPLTYEIDYSRVYMR